MKAKYELHRIIVLGQLLASRSVWWVHSVRAVSPMRVHGVRAVPTTHERSSVTGRTNEQPGVCCADLEHSPAWGVRVRPSVVCKGSAALLSGG